VCVCVCVCVLWPVVVPKVDTLLPYALEVNKRTDGGDWSAVEVLKMFKYMRKVHAAAFPIDSSWLCIWCVCLVFVSTTRCTHKLSICYLSYLPTYFSICCFCVCAGRVGVGGVPAAQVP